MTTRKSNEEKLLELERKKQQISNRIKMLTKSENEKKRKARTRRLIQLGALSEKYLNCENIEPSDYENLLLRFLQIEQVLTIINSKKPE